MNPMPFFILVVSVAAASWLGVQLVRHWACRRSLMDIPNARSSHTRPTPRGGGAAICVCVLAAWLGFGHAAGMSSGILFAASAALVASVGFLDDLRSLPASVRLGAYGVGAAGAILAAGIPPVLLLPGLGGLEPGILGAPLAFLWLLGLTNAYNFMDGIDGIAGVQAVTAGTGWALLGLAYGLPEAVLLGGATAAASLGFLLHNWPPARIFMGDVGSTFLGFSLAFLALLAGRTDPGLPAAGLLLVWPFVFDASFTFLRRLKNGENVFAAHRSHLYQRLVIAGLSHRSVTLLYGALGCLGIVLALAAPGGAVWPWGVAAVGAAGLWLYTVVIERRSPARA